MNVLHQQLAKSTKVLTDTNSDRKTRICVLFTDFSKLTAMIDLYRGILPSFQVFLKRLQHEKPMLHVLHVEMVMLVRDVLSKFMKPEAIPLDVKGLLKLDIQNQDLQYPNKLLSVGKFSHFAVNKARVEKKPWVQELYTSLRGGYTKAAAFLLKNLPLSNIIISSLSALSPSLIQDQHMLNAYSTLAKALPNAISTDELGQLDEEVRAYQTDLDLVDKGKGFDDDAARIDADWWREIFLMKTPEGSIRFPVLGKLVRALLSLFTGPLVEGSFNIMDDIIEKDRVRLNIETYEGFAIIKANMKAAEQTSSNMKISAALRSSCLSSFNRYKCHLQKKTEKMNKEKQRKIREAAKVLSAVRVKKVKKTSSATRSSHPSSSTSKYPASPAGHLPPSTSKKQTPAGHLPPSTSKKQTPAGHLPPSTSKKQTPSGHLPPSTSKKQTPAGHLPPSTSKKQTPAGHLLPSTSKKQTPASHLPPSTSIKQTPASHLPPSTSKKQTPASHLPPSTSKKQTPASHLPPSTSIKQTPAGHLLPSTSKKQTPASHLPPSTSKKQTGTGTSKGTPAGTLSSSTSSSTPSENPPPSKGTLAVTTSSSSSPTPAGKPLSSKGTPAGTPSSSSSSSGSSKATTAGKPPFSSPPSGPQNPPQKRKSGVLKLESFGFTTKRPKK
ncbi:ankyrin repeat and KH domain-containing protein 1-like isoform X2 [Sardina pilchardus]